MTTNGKVAWIGTSNREDGDLDNSRNVELVFRNTAMAARVGQMQANLWYSIYAVPIETAIARREKAKRPNASGDE